MNGTFRNVLIVGGAHDNYRALVDVTRPTVVMPYREPPPPWGAPIEQLLIHHCTYARMQLQIGKCSDDPYAGFFIYHDPKLTPHDVMRMLIAGYHGMEAGRAQADLADSVRKGK